jgi:hypothetical protein
MDYTTYNLTTHIIMQAGLGLERERLYVRVLVEIDVRETLVVK